MIELHSKTNIESLEDAYKKIINERSVDLHVSRNLVTTDFGIVPAIIQFVATWYNNTHNNRIVLDFAVEENFKDVEPDKLKLISEKYFEDFYKLDYVFPLLVYCWNRQIVDNNGIDIKPLLKIQNELSHEKMRLQIAGGGTKTMLSCFDHLSTKKGLLSAFYIGGDFIDNELQFDSALDKSTKQVLSTNRNLRKSNFADYHFDIIAIIYELIKNTHDWGRTDIHNKPLNPNTRGLFMKLHTSTRENLISRYQNHKGLSNYFSQENFETNSINQLHFLELSVFDTGVGFVQRYKKDSKTAFDINTQVEIVKQCLLVNTTSAIGMERTYKGKGLDRIMRILDGKGFFWLRTSNISLFRNLKQDKYRNGGDAQEIELYDWLQNTSSNYSRLEFAKGSVITLVYPISNMNDV